MSALASSALASIHEAHVQRRAAWAKAAVIDRDIDLKAPPKGSVVRLVLRSTYPALDWRPKWRAPVVAEVKRTSLPWKRIIADCALEAEVEPADLIERSHQALFVAPRHKAMWRMRTELGWSLPQIGRRLGGRDHTTVLAGIRQHIRRAAAEATAEAARREQAARKIVMTALPPRLRLLAERCT